MAPEWKEYTGSDEQFSEIVESKNDVLLEFRHGVQRFKSTFFQGDFINGGTITRYLICNPHPLADMICQQAKTGQPVWVDRKDGLPNATFVTTTPNWNIPNAEYSFTPYDEMVSE